MVVKIRALNYSIRVGRIDSPECTWDEANNLQVGGWRLPTIIELQHMHDNLHLNGQGNFVTDNADNNDVYYWSSTVHDDYADAAWAFNFGNYQGEAMGRVIKAKGVPRRVRLVHSLLINP